MGLCRSSSVPHADFLWAETVTLPLSSTVAIVFPIAQEKIYGLAFAEQTDWHQENCTYQTHQAYPANQTNPADTSDQAHCSDRKRVLLGTRQEMKALAQRLPPNNSFKPKPLRGSA
jgi:hypothetical protein